MTTDKTTFEHLKEVQFKEKVDVLNRDFIKHLKKWYDQCHHSNFSAPINSYKEHMKKLEQMYNVRREGLPRDDAFTETLVCTPGSGRKIAKAKRKNDTKRSEKVIGYESISISTPVDKAPRMNFGNVSAISLGAITPVPRSLQSSEGVHTLNDKKLPNASTETAASVAVASGGRKRAIRGGGPLGGTESVVFRGSDSQPISDSKLIAPMVNIPKFTPGFWDKKNGQPEKPSITFGKTSDKEVSESTVDRDEISSNEGTFKLSLNSSKGLLFGNASSIDSSNANSDGLSSKPLSFPAFGTTSKLGFPLFGSTADKVDSKTGPSYTALRTGDISKPVSSFGFPSVGSGLATAPFTFGALPKSSEEKKEGEGEDEGEYVPPKAEVIENDEPGATLSTKCSVFKMVDKQYTKLGVGMLHLKENDGKKSLLIRAATTTGTVWLNSLMNKSMKAVKADDKGEKIRIMCPISASEIGTFLVRFANTETMEKVMKSIEESS